VLFSKFDASKLDLENAHLHQEKLQLELMQVYFRHHQFIPKPGPVGSDTRLVGLPFGSQFILPLTGPGFGTVPDRSFLIISTVDSASRSS
jgi:hypothetical protein